MNIFRKLLRALIAMASLAGFVTGWIFITRSNETASPASANNPVNQMPGMPPLPSLHGRHNQSSSSGSVQTFRVSPSTQQNTQSFAPQMRTGGS